MQLTYLVHSCNSTEPTQAISHYNVHTVHPIPVLATFGMAKDFVKCIFLAYVIRGKMFSRVDNNLLVYIFLMGLAVIVIAVIVIALVLI